MKRVKFWAPRLPALCAVLMASVGYSAPYIPQQGTEVLATVPPGASYASTATHRLAVARSDVALPLAQFYIGRARETGDLRNLGYAQSVLGPWIGQDSSVRPAALVLYATVLQSRHAFQPAIDALHQALTLQPNNAQAWLTLSTVLRVLGRYPDALSACAQLQPLVEEAVSALCVQSVRALNGHLPEAYAKIKAFPAAVLSPEVVTWRDSELGEMAERLGDDGAAEQWLRSGLAGAPKDLYLRGAYADLLLRRGRPAEVVALLQGYESMEPMLLRLVIAQTMLNDPHRESSRLWLENAFALEEQRGDAVHRREQARFLLDVQHRPQAALVAAEQNWAVQREPDDVLVYLLAAHAAHEDVAAQPVNAFLTQSRQQDSRLTSAALGVAP